MTLTDSNKTTNRLTEEFHAVLSETEALLQSAAHAGAVNASDIRHSIDQNVADAKDRLAALQKAAVDRANAVAHSTDDFVHDKPWQALAIVSASALLVGIALGHMLARRSS